MRIGIIGPSKLSYVEEINPKALELIEDVAERIAKLGHEVVLTPDKGSVSELFAEAYSKNDGKKVLEVVPLDDKEFGLSWVNLDLGEHINCGSWRNQPEKLNEESDVLLCIGYSVGGLIEIAYSKWFKPKNVLIINELISGELPKDSVRDLKLEYIFVGDLEKKLMNQKS
ncbi:hypothetical protein HOD75_02960 [archaeon]|jgi:hypothetical protein|nr:hypothetical protein [Candidatus Woesearchaeota archaeon]MBT4135613.1 hypothetical protein [archaeon]MBT4241834.1 hypothetical protein [archaeon]MBT4418382.1 hypothetical protein [archaeon]